MTRDLQQRQAHDPSTRSAADIDVDAEHDPVVARRASNAGLRREVQKKGPDGMDARHVHAAAERGTATPGGPMPHADKIQASFGAHDISGIQAHVDEGSTRQMGAQAYATGNHVVFGGAPDLHTAAHEAAHVVQQARGVNLKGGVGAEGDAYEREADAVADRVVAGKPAGDLLGPVAGGASSQAVQRKPAKPADPQAAHEASDRRSYNSVQSAMKDLAKKFYVWAPKLEAQLSASNSTEAGAGPAENAISAIFDTAMNDAEGVGQLISTAAKEERQTLSPEVKQVQGAFSRFWISASKASNWMKAHGNPALAVETLHKTIEDYTRRIGLEGTKLEPDATVPAGNEKALSKTMINDQLAALEAALASVKAGNAADASRVVLHLRYLDEIAKEHHAELKAHKAKFRTLGRQLEAIRKTQPALADRLAEAVIHLMHLER